MPVQADFTSSSSSSSSCSSTSFSSFRHEVFLSFRGPDTRIGFTGYLYDFLTRSGIRTFFDQEDLRIGGEITPSLLEAIENSKIAIPVFSENYAASSFCLDELVYILECVTGEGRLVLPVFYYVDPSDLLHPSGTYGKALAKHEERFKANRENLKNNMERLQKWKQALRRAAQISESSGFHFKKGSDDWDPMKGNVK